MSIPGDLRKVAVLLVLTVGAFALTFSDHAAPSSVAPDRLTQPHPEKRLLQPRTTWALEDADPLIHYAVEQKPSPPPPSFCMPNGTACLPHIPCYPGLVCAAASTRLFCQ